ncbi:MAG: T9SS type A sorting domain-containing protein [Calditrichaeota bacterium]|nr:T9SS type A sorting domain-containing protein [Calditrichota bacterium]
MEFNENARRFPIRFALFLLVFCAIQPIQSIAQYDSLFYDDHYRTFLTHLPPDYNQNDSTYSLILALHGGLGDAFNMENQSRLSQKTDTAKIKFIVVYPEGVKNLIGKRTWNAGGCCGYARDHNIDDVGFISLLIDTLIGRYRINTNKIYATGMSNGGMLCYRLAAEISNKIAAIAPVASTMVLREAISPQRAVPIIHFHSFLDENIPYYGGVGSGVSRHYNPPVDSVLSVWANLNNCNVQSDTLYHEVGEYLLREWRDCKDETRILCYVTYDGGHSWPGGKRGFIFGDPPSKKINATDLMWEFFQKYEIPSSTNVLEQKKKTIITDFALRIYPNPFNDFATVKLMIPRSGDVRLNIFNMRGKIVKILEMKGQKSGEYSFLFNATGLASGIYFVQVQTNSISFTKKMILLE